MSHFAKSGDAGTAAGRARRLAQAQAINGALCGSGPSSAAGAYSFGGTPFARALADEFEEPQSRGGAPSRTRSGLQAVFTA